MADAAPPPKEAQADTAADDDDDAGAAVAEAAIEAPYIIQPVDPKIFGDSVELLSTGFIGTVMPTIDDLAAQLEEIMKNQDALLAAVSSQGKILTQNEELAKIMETMAQVPGYLGKLVSIKKDMVGMLDKSQKMQKRVEKLKVKKNKQLEQDKKTREKERIKEESLRARPASNVVSNGVVA